MNRLLRVAIVVLGIVLANSIMIGIVLSQTPEQPLAHWTYKGEEGPEFWGSLDPNYALCASGRAQSPIDISSAQQTDLVSLTLNYQPSGLNIFNNGHTIQVNYDAGSSLVYNETEYGLVQFHFHTPSEHTLSGEAFDMELHLVHRDSRGNLAVVGVLLRTDEENNTAFTTIFDNLPAEKGDPQPTELTINAADLLPQELLYYTYLGSLTTPPCTQGVRWLVLQQPVEVSEAQLQAFESIFELNARPVQPLNNRDLLEDTVTP